METVKIKAEARWFCNCPECDAEYDLDEYEKGEQPCICGVTFKYGDSDPANAEEV